MKIPNKVQCGIIAIADIAMNSKNGEAVAVHTIAKRRNISDKYLEQILISLKQFKLIKGIKGSKGGYILARPAQTITFKEIIDALDGSVLNNEISNINDENLIFTQLIDQCLWAKIESYMHKFSSSITLADLVTKYNSTINDNSAESMYYI